MLSLLRIPNLLLLLLSQLVLSIGIVYPALFNYEIQSKFSKSEYLVLILILLVIAAGGYIYNDIQDIETDRTNKKSKIIGWSFSAKSAKRLYIVLCLVPIPLAHFFSNRMGSQAYSLIYYGTIGLLLVYNEYLKKYALLGNLLVASLCGFSTLLIYLAEYQSIHAMASISHSQFITLNELIFGFAFFAFIINLNREIVKDIIDLPGDRKVGYRTLPVLLDISHVKAILLVIQTIYILLAVRWVLNFNAQLILTSIGIVTLVLPGIYINWKIFTSNSLQGFKKASYFLKLQILLGLVYLTIIGLYT